VGRYIAVVSKMNGHQRGLIHCSGVKDGCGNKSVVWVIEWHARPLGQLCLLSKPGASSGFDKHKLLTQDFQALPTLLESSLC
jgi:hypothetical protein